MSASWTKVKSKPQKRDSERTVPRPLSEDDVVSFLSSFKVKQCHIEEFHDHRLCEGHHGDKDRRRNPYTTVYDVTECYNTLETMYHPEIFRTTLCDRNSDCVFGGKLCARAHSIGSLRNRVEASYQYKSIAVADHRQRPTIANFILDSPRKDFRALCMGRWEALRVYPTTTFLALDPVQWFVLQRSRSLRHDIEEVAFENGLGTAVPTLCSKGKNGIELKGMDVDTVATCVLSLFHHQKYFFL